MAASATEEASAAPPLARRARRAGLSLLADGFLLGETRAPSPYRTGGRSRVIDPVRHLRAED